MRGEVSPAQHALDRQFAEGLEWARWAVARWSAFPVDEAPRPVVTVGQRVLVEHGFKSGEAKMAFIEGRIEWLVAVPDGVRRELGLGGKLRGLRSAGSGLVIAAAERGETEFVTDRGPTRLPAWRLVADDALGPIWVLDTEVSDWRPPNGAGGARPGPQVPGQDPGARIEVAADDRTLTLHWLGAPPECQRYLRAEAVESNHAVSFVARGEDTGRIGPRRAIGHVHQVPARLREPLGARVFVDLHGNAGQAIRSPGE